MITYRRFRNTDPPHLTDVWNESLTSRGTFPLSTAAVLERWVFTKPYFDPAGLIVASDESGRVIGFALNGFGPNEELTALAYDVGVISAIILRPSHRRQGVGRELVRHSELYLSGKGAKKIRAGGVWPQSPYGFGIYGGTGSPGFLASDADADPFFLQLGYLPDVKTLVFQKKIDQPLTIADGRFGMLRRRYDTQVLRTATVPSWWHDCLWGTLEPVEFRIIDKLTDVPAVRVVVWELEGYGWRWGCPAAGILDIQVRPDLRRQGLGKLIIAQVMRFVQDQFFGIFEIQALADKPEAVGLCQATGLEQVDIGTSYVKILALDEASLADTQLVSTLP